MKADALTPRQLFDGKMHYEIPSFQRPYVWNEEDQWAPLWEDILRVAVSYLPSESGAAVDPERHFLGAIVYESRPPVVGDVTRHLVIDGQQRTTTLQLVIDAVQSAISTRGHETLAEDLEDLALNKSAAFRGKPERFKLWPSRQDRAAFEQAMDDTLPSDGEHRVLEAHRFFSGESRAWLEGKPDEDGNLPPGTEEQRAWALTSTLQDGLYVVAINLTGHDDSQLIFETLNDRGTPLLKADLIKNWVYKVGTDVGADVDKWPDTHWVDFDDEWWRAEITQGRQMRSRIDIFLQYWLTMRMQDEVKTEQVFRTFTQYAKPHMADATGAEEFLGALRRDADTYRQLTQLDPTSPQGSFHSRVVETMELAATSPLLLWFVSENHEVPASQVAVGLNALESWVIRRTLARATMKGVNQLMVAILKVVADAPVDTAGDAVRDYLARQSADARYWPTDEQMLAVLPGLRLYGNIRQSRIAEVLWAVEKSLRTKFNEDLPQPPKLQVEHVMPQGWRTHWDSEPPLDPEAAANRDQLVNTLGNLTLVTQPLNGSLSHRPWTDAEASGMKAGGMVGRGKRGLLEEFALLVLTKQIVAHHVDAWTDDDIRTRSSVLTEAICGVWPGPPAVEPMSATPEPHQADPSDAGAEELTKVPWTEDELSELAGRLAPTTIAVLDHVATERAGDLLLGTDFAGLNLTSAQVAGVTGALARMVYTRYQRSNPPIGFVKIGGQWHYRMETHVAELWRHVRGAR
ncbi:DUF262 domain-containing protein [Isoptericola sp. b408]|uniref:DUF262 domain-containing protein n=1 Tax=Isoptericola sp. b408 TaxID=3064653 RepID=UPI002712A33A|nr:DUF262 domain-containing HNH endonuclease family protein [Isoptericola sp. b408]MDO8150188.1 DUF262 domain-containing HNH endonuclease family protein [Isoptericola sp. b408]